MEKKRNLWVISTDKPSRLHKYNFEGFALSKETLNWKEAYNIYITSDEEIKEGDYVTNGKCISQAINEWWTKFYIGNPELKADYWKIILTTDQDLIKDGLQKIDDKFLEWFVKNPSCEDIFVTDDYEQVNQDNPILRGSTNVIHKYKIIILKEEPDYTALLQPVGTKQETLEEVAPMEELVIILHKIKKNLTNKTEILTIKLITDTIKTQFVDKELKWQQQTIEEVFEWLTTNNYLTDLKETLIENFKNR